MANGKKAIRKFGIRDCIGYAFGDFGNDFTFILSSTFMMIFYTDVMQVDGAIVGGLMMAARFVDAFTDVAMGQIVDRCKPGKKGKFAPWIRRMCGPVAVASLLLYASWFQDMPMAFKIFWMFFTYLLWGSVCYTGINIPYGSMASAITDQPDQRTLLSTFRNFGATLASTVIGVVLPLVVYYTDDSGRQILSGTNMSIAAVICSIGAVVCYLLCYNLTTERVQVPQKNEKFSLKQLGLQLVHSRPLIGIVVCALILLLTQLSLTGFGPYLYPYYFKSNTMMSVATACLTAVTIVFSFIIPVVSKRSGKKELSTVGAIIGAVAFFILFVVHTTNQVVFLVLYAIGMLGIACFNTLCWAMITDVIDEDEVRNGERSDGTMYSVYSFARKLGQALSSGLVGAVISAIGYDVTVYDQGVADSLYNCTTIVPAIGFAVLALALIFLYPLSKKKVDKNSAILAERHAGDHKNA